MSDDEELEIVEAVSSDDEEVKVIRKKKGSLKRKRVLDSDDEVELKTGAEVEAPPALSNKKVANKRVPKSLLSSADKKTVNKVSPLKVKGTRKKKKAIDVDDEDDAIMLSTLVKSNVKNAPISKASGDTGKSVAGIPSHSSLGRLRGTF